MTTNKEWLSHYSSLDNAYPEEEKVFDEPKKIKKVSKFSLSNKDVKSLLVVKDIIKRHKIYYDERDRALDIKQVNKSNYIDKNSLEHYLIEVMSPSDIGLHINSIIENLEKSGWVFKNKDKHNQVIKFVTKRYYMFEEVCYATFKLREGFRNKKPIKHIVQKVQTPNKLPTIHDIVLTMVMVHAKSGGIRPGIVHKIMLRMGYNLSYSSVYKAMQTDKYKRNGYLYAPKSNVCVSSKEN